jgi:benzil reductase ((S)-benzoin forming)
MSGVSIITGGGTGLGAALAKRLASRSQQVLIVGRRGAKLLETKNESSNPSFIRTVVADVSKPEGHEAILKSLKDGEYVDNLVHNAAVLEPVGPLMDVKPEDWSKHMAINVDGPLFLTKSLLPRLTSRNETDRNGRILHISSGAAHHGYRGWVRNTCITLHNTLHNI